MEYISNSAQETEALGERLAARLRPGDVIAYTGDLGAGKTAFTRGLMQGLGAGDVVSSPTFAIVNEHQGRLTVEHFDMYRVTSWDDLYSTGFFDYLDTDRVLVIEWSENIESVLPPNTITVEISRPQEGDDPDLRRILIRRP